MLVEIAVGVGCALVFAAFRTSLTPFLGDRAPYAFVFLGVVAACVLAAWRSGLIALALGQFLAWYFVVDSVQGSFVPEAAQIWGGLAVATVSQLAILIVIALYQREVGRAMAAQEREMDLLDEALREIDHRTRNNYQTVLAMIDLQARRAPERQVHDALRQISDRIQAIANASEQLAVRSADLDAVRLDDHLCGLVKQIERGLSRSEIEVQCTVDDVTASADTATSISIIVNELVTNAIKHAFNGERSGHVWVTGKSGREFELIVSDDGRGIEASRREGHSGLGTKLVESFARQLGAKHQISSSDKGTMHKLVIPRLE